MPVLPSWIIDPLWDQFATLLPEHVDTHPLGCHRPRVPDRVIFDKLIQVLVFGCAYQRIADHTCSARTLRRRRDEWISAGLAERLRLAALGAYDRLFGLELEQLAVDGSITKAPCGGQVAGPSPVDRRKQGLKRSVAVEAGGIPLAVLPAPANHRGRRTAGGDPGRHRRGRPAARAAHRAPGRRLRLEALPAGPGRAGMVGDIAARGVPAPVQVGRRWVMERTHVWGNQYGKLRWCTGRRRRVVEFWLALASAVIVCGRLVRRAWTSYRWRGRPRRRL